MDFSVDYLVIILLLLATGVVILLLGCFRLLLVVAMVVAVYGRIIYSSFAGDDRTTKQEMYRFMQRVGKLFFLLYFVYFTVSTVKRKKGVGV